MKFDRYVALGDSTTEGLEDPHADGRSYRGWADRLAEIIAARNPGLRYANLAIRGRKLPQIRAEQLEPALVLEPDLASVLGGLNDILRRHVDLDAVTDDMDVIVSSLRAQGATVLMVTYPDPTAVISVAAGRIRARVDSFNERLRGVSERRGAVLIDLDRDGVGHPSLWCADRLHANDRGHARIAAAAATALGLGPDDAEPWTAPELRRRRLPVRIAEDFVWTGRHLAPWVVRRVRGRSSGDGREPKRPDLAPFAAPAPGDSSARDAP